MRSVRWLIASCTIAAAAACGGPQSQNTPAFSAQWAEFRLNGRHDATLPGSLRVSWRLPTRGGFSSSPAVDGSKLYIGNNKGALYAIDVRTGQPLWIYRARAPIMSNPLVGQGLVIAGEGNGVGHYGDARHPTVVGNFSNALFAVDEKGGKLRWRIPLTGSGMPTPAFIDGLLVQHNGAGLISATEPSTGKVRYSVDVESAAAMSAILRLGNGAFATNGGALGFADAVTKRNARDASVVWTASFPSDHWGFGDCPLATDGRSIFGNDVISPPGAKVFYPGLMGTQDAYAIDAASGKIRWDIRYERGPMPQWNLSAIPLVYANTLFFGSALTAFVHAVDPANGRVRWRLRVRGPVKGGIAAKDGIVYFGDLKGYLWAVDARTGKPIGFKNLHASFNVGSPIIDGRTLIVGSNSGDVIAIPLDVIRASHDG